MKKSLIFNCNYLGKLEASVYNQASGTNTLDHEGWIIVACLQVQGLSWEEWPMITTFCAKKPNKNQLRKLKTSAKKELNILYRDHKIEEWLKSEIDKAFGVANGKS